LVSYGIGITIPRRFHPRFARVRIGHVRAAAPAAAPLGKHQRRRHEARQEHPAQHLSPPLAAALAASAGRPELLKLELRWCLAPLLARLERRGSQDELRHGLDTALDQAPTPRELVQRFSSVGEDLGQRLARPAEGDRRQRLRRALNLIQERPEAPGGLGSLARDAGVSASRLSRLLKRDSGEGFARARTQARLEKARRLLAESAIPVANVAQECGWASAAHFSRLFHRAEGMTPQQYRKKKQEEGQ